MNASVSPTALGSVAGLLAAIGVVVMAVIYVRHARRIRQLRRWAGSRPELDARVRTRAAQAARSVREQAVLRGARSAGAGLRARKLAPRVGVGVATLTVLATVVLAYPRQASPTRTPHDGWISRPDPHPGQIQVLNATSVPGLASAAAERLQRAGLHVIGIGVAPRSAFSRIAAGADDQPAALRAARLLGDAAITHSPAKDPARGVDIVVTVGRNATLHAG